MTTLKPDPVVIRQQVRRERRALSLREQHAHSVAVCARLLRHPRYLGASSLGVYLAADGELDLAPVISDGWRTGKNVFLPVLHPFADNKLWFSPWRQGDLLELNRYGIPEPVTRHAPPVSPRRLDLVLVPLVAFDAHCFRIGMGGGYYDRTFWYRRVAPGWKRPKIIGVAHELQRQDVLIPMPWDVVLDAIITEKSFYACSVHAG
ncbi:MAG: 5-formyltetrahydrofolate cyclo-ligase [Pseudomonadota bacterium]